MKLSPDQITTAIGFLGAVWFAIEPIITTGAFTPKGLLLAAATAAFGFFTNKTPTAKP